MAAWPRFREAAREEEPSTASKPRSRFIPRLGGITRNDTAIRLPCSSGFGAWRLGSYWESRLMKWASSAAVVGIGCPGQRSIRRWSDRYLHCECICQRCSVEISRRGRIRRIFFFPFLSFVAAIHVFVIDVSPSSDELL